MTTINFDTESSTIVTQPTTVWTRQAWADAWTERPDLMPLEATWSLAPEASTAKLEYRYGSVLIPGATAKATYTRITTRGYWVLIQYPDDSGSNPWYWLGYAETPIDSFHKAARDTLPESGVQTIPCFGMIDVLRHQIIRTTVHEDPANPASLIRTPGGAIFNDKPGFKRTDKATITEGTPPDDDTSDEAHAFAVPGNLGTDDWWSTRDIVEHLLAFHLPTPTGLTGKVPFSVTNLSQLPTWDRPRVETDGRSVDEILDELLNSSHLLQYGIGVDATPGSPPTIDSIQIVPSTTLGAALSLPALQSVPVNPDLFDIVNTVDPLTHTRVTSDESEVYDQVIFEGPPEIGIATYTHSSVAGGSIEDDWNSTDKSEYEAGGSGAAAWATAGLSRRRQMNEQYRARPGVSRTFRNFRIANAWDGQEANDHDVFVNDGDTHIPYLPDARFLEQLPLYPFPVDYSGDPTAVDETGGRDKEIGTRILLAMHDSTLGKIRELNLKPPEDDVTFFALGKEHAVDLDADRVPFQVNVKVANDNGPTFQIVVNGAPQHAIAASAFTGTVADISQIAQTTYGNIDYKTMQITLAMETQRRPHWKIPDDATVASLDVVRKMHVTADHPAFQLVNIAASTIVRFDDNGDPVVSSGGILRDPTDVITSVATVLAQHHTSPRKRLEIRTQRRPTALKIGGIVSTVSNHTGNVDASIRQITVSTPLRRGAHEVVILAADSVYDPMQLIVPGQELLNAEGQAALRPQPPPNRRDQRQDRLARRRAKQRTQAEDRKWGLT